MKKSDYEEEDSADDEEAEERAAARDAMATGLPKGKAASAATGPPRRRRRSSGDQQEQGVEPDSRASGSAAPSGDEEDDEHEPEEEADEEAVEEGVAKPSGKPKSKGGGASAAAAALPRRTSSRVQNIKAKENSGSDTRAGVDELGLEQVEDDDDGGEDSEEGDGEEIGFVRRMESHSMTTVGSSSARIGCRLLIVQTKRSLPCEQEPRCTSAASGVRSVLRTPPTRLTIRRHCQQSTSCLTSWPR